MMQNVIQVPLDIPIPDLTRPDTLPDTEAWFWSPEWITKEHEANEDIKAGHVSQMFTNADDLIISLAQNV